MDKENSDDETTVFGGVCRRLAAEAADQKYGVDRATIRSICATAKQGALEVLAAAVAGRRGKTSEHVELAEARAEIERLKATICGMRSTHEVRIRTLCGATSAGRTRTRSSPVGDPLRDDPRTGDSDRVMIRRKRFVLRD